MSLSYVLRGDRTLPIILFLHGFMGSSQDFAAVMAHLSDQFCCLAVDLPGHGNSMIQNEGQYTMPETAKLVMDLLDYLDINYCDLFGYSMGGRLALYLAIQYPQRFLKVMLESSSPGLKTERERQARIHHDDLLADRLEADFTSFLSFWYQQPLFQSLQQHPHFKDMIEQRSRNQPRQLAQALRSLSTGRQPSLWEALQQYTGPLLLLAGEQDSKFQALNQEMAAACQSACFQSVPDCGHAIHVERPDVVAHYIRSFLL